MAPKFFATFFFWWPRVLREKNGLRFFMFSSWKIRSMQHVNHGDAAIFQTLEVPKRELLA